MAIGDGVNLTALPRAGTAHVRRLVVHLDLAIRRARVRREFVGVVQEREFRRAFISLARTDGLRAFTAARARVESDVMDDAPDIAARWEPEWWRAVPLRWIVGAAGTLCAASLLAIGAYFLMLTILILSSWAADLNYSLSTFLGVVLDEWGYLPDLEKVSTILIAPSLIYLTRRVIRSTRAFTGRMGHEWGAGMRADLRLRIRVAVNRFASVEYPTRLLVDDAPSLAEAENLGHLVRRSEFGRVKVLTRRLGASAIAISGTRGVGKTALLRYLCDRAYADPADRSLCIRVAAPVTYDTRDFIVNLYRNLCRAVLDAVPPGARQRSAPLVHRLWSAGLAIARFAIILTLVMSLLAWLTDDAFIWPHVLRDIGLPAPPPLSLVSTSTNSFVMILVIAATAYTLLIGRGPDKRNRRSLVGADQRSVQMAQRAADELRRLSFLATMSTENSVGIDRGWLQVGRRQARELAEQSLTLPELVDSYRRFVTDTAAWWRDRNGIEADIVIGIDEIDRIADAEDADRFLNSVKSILDVRACTYVVTVSDEALATFERRIVHVRTAMDSVFDEVVRLGRLSRGESAELIERRVVGFPARFALLCHCMAGGVPRDLIRAVRAVIDARIESRITEFGPLISLVIVREVDALKRGVATRVMRIDPSDARDVLTVKLDDPSWPGRDLAGRAAAAAELRADVSSSTEFHGVALALAAGILFYATLESLFTSHGPMGPNAAMDDLDDYASPARVLGEEIADIRTLLATSASLAYARLNDVLMRMNADVVPTVVPANGRVTDPTESRRIRTWAASKGIDLAARGRIPRQLRDRYQADQVPD
jgi:hypothetical protein